MMKMVDKVAEKALIGGVRAANLVMGGPVYAALAATQPKGKRVETFTALTFGTPLPSDEKK